MSQLKGERSAAPETLSPLGLAVIRTLFVRSETGRCTTLGARVKSGARRASCRLWRGPPWGWILCRVMEPLFLALRYKFLSPYKFLITFYDQHIQKHLLSSKIMRLLFSYDNVDTNIEKYTCNKKLPAGVLHPEAHHQAPRHIPGCLAQTREEEPREQSRVWDR